MGQGISEILTFAVELNIVLAHGLWPRSLTGELTAADEKALRDAAHAVQLDRRQHISVSSTPHKAGGWAARSRRVIRADRLTPPPLPKRLEALTVDNPRLTHDPITNRN